MTFSVFLALLARPSVQASTIFPESIQDGLGLDNMPGCDLCHEGAPTVGSATTLFAETLISRGLVGGQEETLLNALAAIDAEGADSDGDGIADIDELIAGTNPNTASTISPEYGCIGSMVPQSRHSWGLWGGLLAFLGVWRLSR